MLELNDFLAKNVKSDDSLSLNLKLKLKLKDSEAVYMLQMGGCHLIPFSTSEIVLIDRNINTLLSQIYLNSEHVCEPKKFWITDLNSPRFKINPILCAFEGKSRSVPTFNEFCEEISIRSEKIQKYLPKANHVQFDKNCLDSAYEIIERLEQRHSSEIKFLKKVTPLLINRVGDSELRKTEELILNQAGSLGLSVKSLVVKCALSFLYEPKDGKGPLIGRKIIYKSKLKDNPDALAHNALSDLRSLEFLASSYALNIQSCGLCTQDIGLARYWHGVKVSNPRWIKNENDEIFTCDVTPSEHLFPRLASEEVTRLINRLCV